ncbi:hypothetical protein [Falsiroseomonas sp. E2-1-a20]|uniref:hypothetical protein n=1 Tax=Falsiroseomonas sp. E2-1-a20 TaxID=3239300 RepID=UPI003F38FB35
MAVASGAGCWSSHAAWHRAPRRTFKSFQAREAAATRQEAEALVARERPGWQVVEVVEVNDESGPSSEITIRRGDRTLKEDRHLTLLVAEDGRVAGERG